MSPLAIAPWFCPDAPRETFGTSAARAILVCASACVIRATAAARSRFVERLSAEVALAARDLRHAFPFDTVYFGGGTPSQLSAEELGSVLDACRAHLAVETPWIFLEANPEDVTPEACAAWRALHGWGGDTAPFLAAMGLFLTSYLGIAISLWPMIVPHHYTLWQAASSPSTQAFLLIGTLVLLPVILMYTAWSYWVFRGKMRGDIGY